MDIKTMMGYHLTPDRMAAIKKKRNNKCLKGCREKGALITVGGSVNWYSQYGKQYGGFSKKLRTELII